MEETLAELYGKKIIAALYVALLCVSLYFTFNENSEKRQVSRVRPDTKSFVGAINTYYVDELTIPPVVEAPAFFNTYDPTNGTTTRREFVGSIQ